MLNELSVEEKSRSYSKYFYVEPAHPPEAKLSAMQQPIDSSKALPIERLNDLLNPGYLEVEAGWCILPNGAGFVANLTTMPGVTVEMLNWWFSWHALESLRYKIWFPPAHFATSVSDEDRQKLLKLETPLTAKFQGTTHHVVEDIGGGPEKITIAFLTPEDAGFDMSRFRAPFIGTVMAGNGRSRPVNAPFFKPSAPAFMCHAVREVPGGVEVRTRFWLGYHMIKRKPRKLLPPFVRVPAAAAKGLAIHGVREYTNLAVLLPTIYEEQKQIWE